MTSIVNSKSSEEIKSKHNSVSSVKSIHDDAEFLEKLDEYYRLKNKYDTKVHEKKNSILKDNNLSMKQKREKYGKFKFKCINCSRNVNTIFNIDNGILTAICGDKSSPCKLNIKINRGKFMDLRTLIDTFQSSSDDFKEEIIASKLKLLFGYKTEVETLKSFKGLKKELMFDLESLAEYKTEFINVIYNMKNKDVLKNKMILFYRYIENIKDSMKEYNETGENQIIKDIISLYQRDLKPLLSDINSLEYKKRSIDYNESTNVYHLKKEEYTLSELLVPFSIPEIESFNIYTAITPTKTRVDDDISKTTPYDKIDLGVIDMSNETQENKKVTIKEVDGAKIIFLGDKELINKMDFTQNADIYNDGPSITAIEANKLGYIMEMIYISKNKPELIAIDTADGTIYKVIT